MSPAPHDVKADQIVPADDERNLDLRCLFANVRWPSPGRPAPPPVCRAGRPARRS